MQVSNQGFSKYNVCLSMNTACLSLLWVPNHWVIYKPQKFIFHSSRDWKSGSRVTRTVGFWWEPSSELQTTVFLLCPRTVEEALWSSFKRALISFTRVPSSWPHYLSNGPSNAITLRARILTYEFGGEPKYQNIAILHHLMINTSSIGRN